MQSNYTSNILLSNLSDHLPCYVEINKFYAGKKEATKIKKRKLNNDNINKIKKAIGSVNWEGILSDMSALELFAKFHNKIIEIIDKIAPEYEVHIRNKSENKPWISKGIANSIRKSKQLFEKAIADPTLQDKYNNYLKMLKQSKENIKSRLLPSEMYRLQTKYKNVMGVNK